MSSSTFSRFFRFACVLATLGGLSSCANKGAAGSPYASTDGGYNPYPGQGGLAQQGGGQRYAEAPPPPPPGYDAPAENFERAPRSYSGGSSTKSSKSKSRSYSSSGSSAGRKSPGGYVYSGGSTHIVMKGDTLYSIAQHNHTTVARLKTLNHLKSNTLAVGQRIRVK